MTLPDIFDMISHDSKKFPMTLNLKYLLMQHYSQAHPDLYRKVINQTLKYITKWKVSYECTYH